jgi:hypothetical protein
MWWRKYNNKLVRERERERVDREGEERRANI